MILEEISHYTNSESHITVLAPLPVEQMKSECSGAKYESMQIVFEQGNPADRPTLERLLDLGSRLVMILNPTDSPDIQISDAATMIALLHEYHFREIGQEIVDCLRDDGSPAIENWSR